MSTVVERTVGDWQSLLSVRREFDEAWLFRGQPSPMPLATTLERACERFEVPASAIPAVERQMIREFRRRYTGRHRPLILSDTLYCMALMQHHGAPTRLLDFTYSFYVAAYFALEKSGDDPVMWCVNGRWCRDISARVAGHEHILARENVRDEGSFRALFMADPPYRLVLPENPFPLHRRLIIQQGVFACPGDVTAPFLDNLRLAEGSSSEVLLKLRLAFDSAARRRALAELAQMNIDRASLFPGLDGFAQSLELRIPLYQRIAAAWAEEGSEKQRFGPAP